MLSIENDHLKIEARAKGAELTRIFSKNTGLEYLWNGDPAYWAKHSPILFPIVGTLKNNAYHYENKTYALSRHGFARDMDFELTSQSDSSLTFTLVSNTSTLAMFPFEFKLEVIYTLESNKVKVGYHVLNTGSREMYFSIGGHPAFRVPFEQDAAFEDYYIEFTELENTGRWPITQEGLIGPYSRPLLNDTRILPITHGLFSQDALVFKYLNSHSLTLRSHTSKHGIGFHFEEFPFLGLWSAKNANFLCVEPWCGIADSVEAHQQLTGKEGINMITPGQLFRRQWSAELF